MRTLKIGVVCLFGQSDVEHNSFWLAGWMDKESACFPGNCWLVNSVSDASADK